MLHENSRFLKGWTPFPHRGEYVAFFGGLNWAYLGFEVSEWVKFFCCELWTHRHPLGVQPAPKSICTHQAHTLKLLARENGKIGQFRPIWNSAAWRPQVPFMAKFCSQRINLVQKYPFYGSMTIPDLLHDLGEKPKRSIFFPGALFTLGKVKAPKHTFFKRKQVRIYRSPIHISYIWGYFRAF